MVDMNGRVGMNKRIDHVLIDANARGYDNDGTRRTSIQSSASMRPITSSSIQTRVSIPRDVDVNKLVDVIEEVDTKDQPDRAYGLTIERVDDVNDA
jgi:hypothetical protein